MDLWTRSCLSTSCFLSFVYLPKYFQKVWTGGHAQKSLKKNYPNYFKLRTCQHEVVFLFHVSFLSCTLQNVFKKCGQVDKFWKFWKKHNFNLIFFIFKKCGHVDKKLSFYFIFSFFLVLCKIFSKSVDRWTSSENSEKKLTKCILLFKIMGF